MAKKNFISAVLAAVALVAVVTSASAQIIGGSCEVNTATGPRDGAWLGGVCVAPMVSLPVVPVGVVKR